MPVKTLSSEEIKNRENRFFSEWRDGGDIRGLIKPVREKDKIFKKMRIYRLIIITRSHIRRYGS